jgi:hypothetical protein
VHRFAFCLLAACAADSTVNPEDPDPQPMPDPLAVDDQSPPTSHAAIGPWLAEGAYLTWACEPVPHPARPPGAHGENRICSNDLLSASATGAYPIGAATVKELYRNGELDGYAVMRKLADTGAANDWYWYELIGTSVVADGRSPGICTGCHGGAPRDFIFTRVE